MIRRQGHPAAVSADHQGPQVPLAIEVAGLTRVFRVQGRRNADVIALNGVDLSLPVGSFTALVGASGCGKSTLLQCIAGLDAPTDGTVQLLGTRTSSLRPRPAARFRARHVGFVFQDDNLVTSLSARDNVALPGRLRRKPLSRPRRRRRRDRSRLARRARRRPRYCAWRRARSSCPEAGHRPHGDARCRSRRPGSARPRYGRRPPRRLPPRG